MIVSDFFLKADMEDNSLRLFLRITHKKLIKKKALTVLMQQPKAQGIEITTE
jgi:hypothetical protein